MGFLENYVSFYTSGTPKGFDLVAPRLREGVPPLRIRKQLEEERDLSRLAAGKMVEGTEKYAKAAKANIIGGTGFLLVGLLIFLFVNATSLGAYAGMFLGVVQIVAGVRGRREYKQAGTSSESTGVRLAEQEKAV